MYRKILINILENILETEQKTADYYNQQDEDEKRSIATLAKNGQFPSREPETEMESLSDSDDGHKRNLASMARSGFFSGKRNIHPLPKQLEHASGKRSVGAVMRSHMFPVSGKGNIASIARNGYFTRNVGTLARDWELPKFNGKYMNGKLFPHIKILISMS